MSNQKDAVSFKAIKKHFLIQTVMVEFRMDHNSLKSGKTINFNLKTQSTH